MNRRGFLWALVGLAAAPAVENIATPFHGPALSEEIEWIEEASGDWTVVDLRALAKARLAEWPRKEYDRILFDAITASVRRTYFGKSLGNSTK